MKRKLLFLIFFLSLSFFAKASISITTFPPTKWNPGVDNFRIVVAVTSTNAVDVVKMKVGTTTVNLVREGNFYATYLSLQGFAQGEIQFNFFVQDILGNTQTKIQIFDFDRIPNVNVISPINGASYQQAKIRIKASVSDPGNANCTGTVYYGNSSFTYINAIDTLVDILPAGKTSSIIDIIFEARDNKNQTNRKTVSVYFDTSSYLKYVFSSSGTIVDFKGTRALFLEKDSLDIPALKIIDITTGVTESINLGSGVSDRTFGSGILTDTGAALYLEYGGADSVYVWKNSTLTNICRPLSISGSGVIEARGNNLIWLGEGGWLYLTDLTTLNNTVISSNLGEGPKLADNGDIIYSRSIGTSLYVIEKYIKASGTKQTITSSGIAILPSIDQNNIVYTIKKQTGGDQETHLYNGTTDIVLGNHNSFVPIRSYLLANKYVAFVKADGNGVDQVWLVSPGQTFKQLSSFVSNASKPDGIGNNGRVIFSSGGLRFYADSLTTAKAVQSDLGRVYFYNGDFYVAISGTIYRYEIPSATLPAKISSATPLSAAKGTSINIKGFNFSNVSGVTFGGVAAQSFTVVSDTVMTAVVGNGASGAITLSAPAGAASLNGFIYLPPPIITSFSPTTASGQQNVTITGTNFTGATAVSFGGTPAASFTLSSGTSIAATVGNGSSGNVSVTTPYGNSVISGFTFVPMPVITANGTTNLLSGGSVSFSSTISDPLYTYQWLKDGTGISGATTATYSATASGSYALKITLNGVSQTSQPIVVNVTFALPPNNFKVTNTSSTCIGSTNGAINITAVQSLNYTAIVTNSSNVSTSYPFTTTLDINNLPAGTYQVCLSVAGQTAYKQCFTSTITEPKALSLYSTMVKGSNQVVLSMDGAAIYHISLNGVTTTSSDGQVTLTLKNGLNKLMVTTDKECQGVITRDLILNDNFTPYPNPFVDFINVNLGYNAVKNTTIEVYNTTNLLIYKKQYTNSSGSIQVDLQKLDQGLYILKVDADGRRTSYKIIKN